MLDRALQVLQAGVHDVATQCQARHAVRCVVAAHGLDLEVCAQQGDAHELSGTGELTLHAGRLLHDHLVCVCVCVCVCVFSRVAD